MKKIILFVVIFLHLAWVGKAQVSYGGTPYSIGSHYRASDLAQIEVPTFVVPILDMQAVRRQDAQAVNSNRFALATYIQLGIDTQGLWQDLPTGDRLWRINIKLQGHEIYGMRVFFDDFQLPEGGKLYMYSPDHQIMLGAFTAENNKSYRTFATTLIKSTDVVIEYLEPAGKVGKTKLHINRIDQAYRETGGTFKPSKSRNDKLGFGSAGSCNLNVNCTNLANDWRDEQRGIVRILTVDASGSSFCSGSLIGNTAQNAKPYILTAYHCTEDANATHLNSWTFNFNYEITNCNNTGIEPSTSQSITGATMRSQYAPSDFALLELQQNIPANYNAKWNSWDRSGTNVSGAVCIHHPSGDVKKFTVDTDMNSTNSYYDDQPNDNTHYKQIWNNGTTEGGSSGSPLFSSAGNIIGQLHGGNALCSAPNEPDWFGKFSVSWTGGGTNATRLSNWLDPIGSGAVILTSTEQSKPQNPFKLYPNPAQNNPYLAYEAHSWGGQTIEVVMHSIDGKLAYQQKITLPTEAEKIEFRTTLPKGLYLVQIKTSKGIFEDKLMIE